MSSRRHSWLAPAVGLLVLSGCADDVKARAEDSTPPDVAEYVVLLDDDSDPDQVQGAPGAYAFSARGSGTPPLAVMDVPEGFSNFGFWMVWPLDSGSQGGDGSPLRAVQYWTVNGVYTDPCRRAGTAPEIGPGVDDLVTALTAQRRTQVTEPVPVSLGGHEGVTLELDVPDSLALERCTEGRYMFWEGSPGDAHHQTESEAVERLWVLNVAGQRVVLAALVDPDVPKADVEALTAMVESVRFAERK